MFITHGDAQLYTVAFGKSDRTLLALGGWAGSWELWTEPFQYLSQTWRTIAYDHRGTGATIAPVESITIENMVEDVFVILDAMQVETCVLAAESAGAITALSAALRQPHRFKGLVIVDGLYHQPMPTGESPFVQGLKHHYEGTIGQFVDGCTPEPDSAAIRHWGRQILGGASQVAAIQLYEAVYGVDLREQVSQINQPTLILHGELDRMVPVEAAQWLATQIPQCHLEILPGAGHVPTITRPQVVAEAINRYFA